MVLREVTVQNISAVGVLCVVGEPSLKRGPLLLERVVDLSLEIFVWR